MAETRDSRDPWEIRNKGNQTMTIIKLTAEVISLSLFLAGVAAICIAVAN